MWLQRVASKVQERFPEAHSFLRHHSNHPRDSVADNDIPDDLVHGEDNDAWDKARSHHRGDVSNSGRGYADIREARGMDAVVTDAFNLTFDLWGEEGEKCLFDTVDKAVNRAVAQREKKFNEKCTATRKEIRVHVKSELRRSSLVQDGLPNERTVSRR